MREIRLALLEADVNLGWSRTSSRRVKERAVGEDVTKSLTPGQQVVKIVHEELTAMMGGGDSRLAFAQTRPDGDPARRAAGLGQDDGRRQARADAAQGRAARPRSSPPTSSARPRSTSSSSSAARSRFPVYAEERKDPVAAAEQGVEWAKEQGADVVIVDTAGRHQVDDDLMDELERIAQATKPTNVLLVLDAMTGQEAVNVAEAFQERVAFDGIVLTKLDGDARGGAALSVRAVTGRPVKLASTGEKLDQLEWFHPDRMASRILGMGDVLTLIEKAEEAVEADEQAEMEKRMRAGEFTFDDFLASYKMLRRMGSLKGVLSMIPGLGNQLKGVEVDERELARVEAIILSMTPRERGYPHTIDGSRRQRIARGSGTTVQEVSRLLNARKEMQKLMKRMGQGQDARAPANDRSAEKETWQYG